jgi:uncharacterized phiE125 gp8 family phage protein
MSHQGALIVTTPPTIEPVTLVEAKEHLRVTEADEDSYITGLITMAREMCEEYQRRSYIETGFDFWLRAFPSGGEIVLPRSPLRVVSAVSYFTPDDTETVVDAAVYNVDDVTKPGRIVRAESATWPTATLRTSKGVKISFTAGHGTLAADVPQRMIHAIKLIIADFFEQRQPIVVGTIAAELPLNVKWLLDHDRLGGMVG